MGKVPEFEMYQPDHPIFSEGLRIYGKPSLPSTKTPPDATDGQTQAPKRSNAEGRGDNLPDAPERENFHSQEEFEEARGYWFSHVGRIRGMVDRARAAKDSAEQDRRTDATAPAQGDGAVQAQQRALAVMDTLIETIDILMTHLSEADGDKAHEAISVMLMQVMHVGGLGSDFMQQVFPVMDRLQRLIVSSNLGEALAQAELFKTQLQEVQQLIRPK
jgi:hypothetical protein